MECRTVAEVARKLGCDWHTVDDAVMAYGAALLDADVDRVGQVQALGSHAKELIRSIYDIDDPALAGEFVNQLGLDLQDGDCPPENQTLDRTLLRWRDRIVAWHMRR